MENKMNNEWDNEEDQYRYQESGYECLIRRCNFGGKKGHLCGYVIIPEGHPFHGKGCSEKMLELALLKKIMMDKPLPDNPSISLLLSAMSGEVEDTMENVMDVHGGINFSKPDPYNKSSWMIGFDCAHSRDRVPAVDSTSDGVYRNVEYVKSEITKLIAQVIEVGQVGRELKAASDLNLPVNGEAIK